MDKHARAVAAFLGAPIGGAALAFGLYAAAGEPCRLNGTTVTYGQCVMGMSLGDAATRLGLIGLVAGTALAIAFEKNG